MSKIYLLIEGDDFYDGLAPRYISTNRENVHQVMQELLEDEKLYRKHLSILEMELEHLYPIYGPEEL